MTAKQAAAALGISERTVRRAIDRGELRATKVSGVFRVTTANLTAYRTRNRVPPRPTVLTPVPVTAPPLPAPPTTFVGREQETGAALNLLGRDDVHLVTLVGPGGVGKTRLALAVATAAASNFPGGVWWVSLAALDDPALVLPTIAGVFGVRETGDRSVRGRLAVTLRQRRALLVLDNLEQVIDAAVEIAALLIVAPGLKILTTSREPLNIAAEVILAVPPLATSDPMRLPSLAEIATAPAVRLFVSRAVASVPGFELNEHNAVAVAAICQRLDGIPLAIELAATRIRLLPPAAMLARLGQRLPLLTGGPRDAPARHRTMRDAIAWSHDLLGPAERALFRDLAVFAGGAPLDAIEAVCNGDDDVINVLSSLADKNLLAPVSEGDATARVVMLETVREYALEQLAAWDGADALHSRHAAWFLELAEAAQRERRSPSGAVSVSRIVADEANLGAAFTCFEQTGDAGRMLRLAIAMRPYWYNVRSLREGYRWLERAIAHGRSTGAARSLLAQALTDLAGGATGPDAHRRAIGWLDEALAIQRSLEEWQAVGHTLTEYGGQLDAAGDYARSVERFAEAAAIFHRIEDGFGHATALWNQADAMLALGPGAVDKAALLADEALAAGRTAGNPDRIALALCGVAQIALVRGEWARARDHLLEALGTAEAIGFLPLLADLLVGFAGVAERVDDPAAAARLLGAATSIREALDAERFFHHRMFERVSAAVTGRLDNNTYQAAFASGSALSHREMIAAARAVAVRQAGAPARPGPAGMNLTPRELEVLRLLCDGVSNQAIADALFISRVTVKNHVTGILTKLNVTSRTAAVSYAHRHGLL